MGAYSRAMPERPRPDSYPGSPRPRTTRRSRRRPSPTGAPTGPSRRRSNSGDSRNEYVFYDGPPFANGLPHYGHLLTGFVKDAMPRYQTMRGRRVERRFGWDCHGLPAETEAEKELGVSGHGPITEYGIDRFNDYCRDLGAALHRRPGSATSPARRRWVDFEHDYKTMDLSYMESVMWAFKSAPRRGPHLRGLPGAALLLGVRDAALELRDPPGRRLPRPRRPGGHRRLRPRRGPGEADGAASSPARCRLLVWTTTPWTLPSNLALAVGPDLTYAVYERDGRALLVVGEARVDAYAAELDGAEARSARSPAAELVGRSYRPLFDYFAGPTRDRNAFRVARRRLRHHRGGHGHRPHGPGLR